MHRTDYLREIRKAIRATSSCESVHFRVEPVTLFHGNETLWQGTVEVFTLQDCPESNTCYAWGFARDEDLWEYVAFLHKPPIVSATRAVQAYMLQQRTPRPFPKA